MQSGDNFHLLEACRLARERGGRPRAAVVPASFARLPGQPGGKIVAPELYIAVGIWRDPASSGMKVRLCRHQQGRAPIFQIADCSRRDSSAIPSRRRAGKTRRTELTRIGVVGAGQMGRGIAHVCALAARCGAHRWWRGAFARAREIGANLGRQVARGRIRRRKARLCPHRHRARLRRLWRCDRHRGRDREGDIKREVFKRWSTLKPRRDRHQHLVVSITRLASATDRPGKFIGMHL